MFSVLTGIDPAKDSEHFDYIQEFRTDFMQTLKRDIQRAISERNASLQDPLEEEVSQHLRLCQDQSRRCLHRDDVVEVDAMGPSPTVCSNISICALKHSATQNT